MSVADECKQSYVSTPGKRECLKLSRLPCEHISALPGGVEMEERLAAAMKALVAQLTAKRANSALSALEVAPVQLFGEYKDLLHFGMQTEEGVLFPRVRYRHPGAPGIWLSMRMVNTPTGCCYEVCVSWARDSVVTLRGAPIAHETYRKNGPPFLRWLPNQKVIRAAAEKTALDEFIRVMGIMCMEDLWASETHDDDDVIRLLFET